MSQRFFNSTSACDKCGWRHATAEYVANLASIVNWQLGIYALGDHGHEAIVRRCERCGFCWEELPLDRLGPQPIPATVGTDWHEHGADDDQPTPFPDVITRRVHEMLKAANEKRDYTFAHALIAWHNVHKKGNWVGGLDEDRKLHYAVSRLRSLQTATPEVKWDGDDE